MHRDLTSGCKLGKALTNIIGKAFPKKYKLPKTIAPKFLMFLLGRLFGVTCKFVNNNVGHKIAFNNSRSINDLKLDYYPVDDSVRDMIIALDK